MKTIYISGKISGLPMDEVRANFRKASEYILSLGHLPSNPLNNGLDETCSWEKHMRADISMLMKADAIYMLDNWQSSKGATIEHNLAEELGLGMIYDNDNCKPKKKKKILVLGSCGSFTSAAIALAEKTIAEKGCFSELVICSNPVIESPTLNIPPIMLPEFEPIPKEHDYPRHKSDNKPFYYNIPRNRRKNKRR